MKEIKRASLSCCRAIFGTSYFSTFDTTDVEKKTSEIQRIRQRFFITNFLPKTEKWWESQDSKSLGTPPPPVYGILAGVVLRAATTY